MSGDGLTRQRHGLDRGPHPVIVASHGEQLGGVRAEHRRHPVPERVRVRLGQPPAQRHRLLRGFDRLLLAPLQRHPQVREIAQGHGQAALEVEVVGVGGHCQPVVPHGLPRRLDRLAVPVQLVGEHCAVAQCHRQVERVVEAAEQVHRFLHGRHGLLVAIGAHEQVGEVVQVDGEEAREPRRVLSHEGAVALDRPLLVGDRVLRAVDDQQAARESGVELSSRGRVDAGGQAVGDDALGDGSDSSVEVDVPALGEEPLDRVEHRRIEVRYLGERGERRSTSSQRQGRIRGKDVGQALAHVRPPRGRRGEKGDGPSRVGGWVAVMGQQPGDRARRPRIGAAGRMAGQSQRQQVLRQPVGVERFQDPIRLGRRVTDGMIVDQLVRVPRQAQPAQHPCRRLVVLGAGQDSGEHRPGHHLRRCRQGLVVVQLRPVAAFAVEQVGGELRRIAGRADASGACVDGYQGGHVQGQHELESGVVEARRRNRIRYGQAVPFAEAVVSGGEHPFTVDRRPG